MGKAISLRTGRLSGLLAFIIAFTLVTPASLLASPAPQGAPHATYNRSSAAESTGESLGYVPNEIIVKLSGRATLGDAALAGMLDCYGLTQATEITPGTYKLRGGSDIDVRAAAEALEATGAVAYAGPNRIYRAMNSPNDEQYVAGQQWGVTQVKAEQAWDITTGSTDIVIAILDTGTATDHPDLESKIVGGYDFANRDDNPYDDEGHGTYTAGIAAAESNNGQGVVGMSWGARIMPVKVLRGPQGTGTEEDIALGIRWAADNGARIINASLGGDEDSPVMREAVQYAAERNVLVVAAAGNTPDGKPHYPAGYDSVLAVGATGRSDTFTGFSSWGRYVDVTAPGVGILSTGWDGGITYEYQNGTSASCPFVSGVAALVWSVNPSLTAVQVKQIIEDSSDDLGNPGWDEHYGMGRLNAHKAVLMAQQGPPPPRTPTPVGQPTNTPLPTMTPAPGQGPNIQVSTTNVAPGSLISIVGGGFGPNELVDLRLVIGGRTDGLGGAQTGAQGGFRAEVALPAALAPGKVTLEAVGQQTGRKASVQLTVGGGSGGNGGQSSVRGTLRGGNIANATVRLKPSAGVPGAEMSATADGRGAFAFGGLAAGLYSLTASATGMLPAGPYAVQVDGSATDVKTLDITMSAGRPAAFDRAPQVPDSADRVYFQPVGHTLKGPFLRYWREKGGLPVFGYPLSEEFQEVSATDGKTYTVQYFERNRFELHPEFAGTPNEVLMGLLGVDMTRGRTFPPGTAFESTATHLYFPETRHSLGGPFLKYWREKGGLAIFGYPISEEIMENGYRVQYFERNRFEHHPEYAGSPNEVLLGLLGVETAKQYGWIAP
jgi:subtilisin family serine protease